MRSSRRLAGPSAEVQDVKNMSSSNKSCTVVGRTAERLVVCLGRGNTKTGGGCVATKPTEMSVVPAENNRTTQPRLMSALAELPNFMDRA